MITTASLNAYRLEYPEDSCAFAEPSSLVFITNSKNESYISPFNETDETFIRRLKRSIHDGINYFYHEWEKYQSENSILY